MSQTLKLNMEEISHLVCLALAVDPDDIEGDHLARATLYKVKGTLTDDDASDFILEVTKK